MLPGSGRRAAAVALVCALLAVAAAPGPAGAAVDGSGASPGVVPQQGTPTNETVRHEKPDEVDRQGDLEAVEGYLAGRLSERLGEATASIDAGRYEAARSLLGDEYDAALAGYVEVAGETDADADDAAAESFREAGNRTRAFSDSVRTFDETYEAYRRAVERGDTARARELGRRLIERARGVERTEDRLAASLQSIEDATGRETGDARERVGAVGGSVEERAGTVANETFVRTRLSAEAAPTDASFVEPTTVRGRLVAANGSGLAGETVLVGIDGEAVVAETNGSGVFVATYRPVRLPSDAAAVPVRYVPADASGYLDARANASVAVTPVTPRVTANGSPDSAAFGDALAVSGSVAAEGVPVPGVPLVATVGGVPLATGVTDGNGTYALSGTLAASVPDGERQVTVRLDQSERAVGAASAVAPVSVEPTPTTLTLAGDVGANASASVSGRLRTDDGRPLPGRTVRLLVDGRPAGSVETDGDGRFSAQVSADVDGGGANVTVAARFDGARTSLEGSGASVALVVPDAADAGPVDRPAAWEWLAALVAVGLLAAMGLLARRRGSTAAGDEATGFATGGEASGGSAPADEAWREAVAGLLDDDETDAAVERAYAAARGRLASELDAAGALTHWEFYAAARDGLGSGRLEALGALTEAYERARFAPGQTPAGEAVAAVERADEALSG